MNSLRFNGGAINSARVVAALALVTCTSTASIAAAATYVYRGSASIPASASVSVNPTRKAFGSSVALIGASTVTVNASQKHSVGSAVLGTSLFQAYSLRAVNSSASFLGFATFDAVPASTLGYVNIVGQGGISASATPIRRAQASMPTSGSLVLGQPILYRKVQANIVGSGTLYPEVGINHVFEAYSKPIAYSSVSIQDAGVVVKRVGALIYGISDFSVQPKHQQKANATIVGAAQGYFDPRAYQPVYAQVVATAGVSASLQYHYRGISNIQGTASIAPVVVKQKHMGNADVLGTVSIPSVALKQVHRGKAETITGTANVASAITYWRSPTANIVGTADLTSATWVKHAARTQFAANATVTSAPIVPIPYYVASNMTGTATLVHSKSVVKQQGKTLFTASATMQGYPEIPIPKQAVSQVTGTGSIRAIPGTSMTGSVNFTVTGYLQPIGYRNLMGHISASRRFTRPASIRRFIRTANSRSFGR